MKTTLLFWLCAAAAAGLNAQTWVATTGTDTPSCGARTSPCATFAQAFALAPVGGLIKALNAGDFGPVTINHAIIIDGSGAAISSGVTAITIAAGASDRVTIRSLTILASDTGMSVSASVQLYLYDVAIEGHFADGISLLASDATGTMTADNLRITGATSVGLGNVGFSVTLKNSTFASDAIGVTTRGNSAPSVPASTTIEHCHVAANSGAGIVAGSGGTVRIDNTEIVNNQTGILIQGGQVISYRTNTFANNVTDGTPSLTASQK